MRSFGVPLLVLLGLALACGACAAPPDPPTPPAKLQATVPPAAPKANCGMSPGDWCTSADDGPCGAHADEAACRADDRCRGMRYRGESLVACNPDGKGFWSNCPAVGCLARTGVPGQMPSPEVLMQLCRNGVYAKAAAEIVVWRNGKNESAVLEVRAQDREAGTGRYYYDPDGERLASTPAREFESSDLGRAQAQQRDALLRGLHEAEVNRCGTAADAKT